MRSIISTASLLGLFFCVACSHAPKPAGSSSSPSSSTVAQTPTEAPVSPKPPASPCPPTIEDAKDALRCPRILADKKLAAWIRESDRIINGKCPEDPEAPKENPEVAGYDDFTCCSQVRTASDFVIGMRFVSFEIGSSTGCQGEAHPSNNWSVITWDLDRHAPLQMDDFVRIEKAEAKFYREVDPFSEKNFGPPGDEEGCASLLSDPQDMKEFRETHGGWFGISARLDELPSGLVLRLMTSPTQEVVQACRLSLEVRGSALRKLLLAPAGPLGRLIR